MPSFDTEVQVKNLWDRLYAVKISLDPWGKIKDEEFREIFRTAANELVDILLTQADRIEKLEEQLAWLKNVLGP